MRHAVSGRSVPTARMVAVTRYVHEIEAAGAPVERMLGHAGIRPDMLGAPELAVPLRSALRFVELACQALGTEHLGLRVGLSASLADLGPNGYRLQHAVTVQDYLRRGITLFNTLMTGQPRGSVLVAAADMAQTCIDRRSNPDYVNDPPIPPQPPSGLGDAWDFVTALRALIRPYLAQGHPHLSLVAEIVGMSERTLQRRLAHSGLTYSDIVQESRFSIASDLMADSDLNIADIAFAAGYENAPHFSRAFKRLTGTTPRAYRCGLA